MVCPAPVLDTTVSHISTNNTVGRRQGRCFMSALWRLRQACCHVAVFEFQKHAVLARCILMSHSGGSSNVAHACCMCCVHCAAGSGQGNGMRTALLRARCVVPCACRTPALSQQACAAAAHAVWPWQLDLRSSGTNAPQHSCGVAACTPAVPADCLQADAFNSSSHHHQQQFLQQQQLQQQQHACRSSSSQHLAHLSQQQRQQQQTP